MVWLTIALAALAQSGLHGPGARPPATVSPGVPLRVALEQRVAIKRVGEPIHGRLVEPIYVFDGVALPAGTIVRGHIAEIGGVPAGRRIRAILSGNLTPPRDARAQFDSLVLSDGSERSLRTSLSTGVAHTVRVVARGKSSANGNEPAIRAFKAPSKLSQLKSTLTGMLPYHRQAWRAGTLFNAVFEEPLTGLPPTPVDLPSGSALVARGDEREVRARLLVTVNSAMARRGAPVEAIVTRPLFSADHTLLIPEGARLWGDVVEAQPARLFHRNGKVLFVFRQIQQPGGIVQSIQGNVEGMEVDFDAHLAVDSEGVARTKSPKTRFIFPAIAVAVAGLSFHQDYDAEGVPDQDVVGRAESGAVGFGVLGTVLGQTSHSLASGIAVAGAAFSVYSTFIARGENVILPSNTPVEISLKSRGGAVYDRQPMK